MKLTSVEYNAQNIEWHDISYLPSNSRHILIYSPEFGTSIGYYDKLYTYKGTFVDLLRIGEKINIMYWRELPRYVEH